MGGVTRFEHAERACSAEVVGARECAEEATRQRRFCADPIFNELDHVLNIGIGVLLILT